MIDRPDRLRAVPGFAGCTDAQLDTIALSAEEAEVPAGHSLVADGHRARSAYLIVEGEASVLVDGGAVALIGPGCLVGNVTNIDRARRMTTVRTTTAVTVLVIDPRALSAIIGPAEPDDERVADGQGQFSEGKNRWDQG